MLNLFFPTAKEKVVIVFSEKLNTVLMRFHFFFQLLDSMIKLTVFCFQSLVLLEKLLNFVFELSVYSCDEFAFLVGPFHFTFGLIETNLNIFIDFLQPVDYSLEDLVVL